MRDLLVEERLHRVEGARPADVPAVHEELGQAHLAEVEREIEVALEARGLGAVERGAHLGLGETERDAGAHEVLAPVLGARGEEAIVRLPEARVALLGAREPRDARGGIGDGVEIGARANHPSKPRGSRVSARSSRARSLARTIGSSVIFLSSVGTLDASSQNVRPVST